MVRFGPVGLIDSTINLANLIIKRKGERYRSRKLYQIALDFANVNFQPINNRFDWTTSDEEEASLTENDEKQSFMFTASAYRDLFKLVKLANSSRVIKTVPKDLPIYFFSGKEDPVGEKGAGVKRAVKLYKTEKIKNVSIKLYDNCRHEMLREKNRIEVFKDVLDFIDLIRFGEE